MIRVILRSQWIEDLCTAENGYPLHAKVRAYQVKAAISPISLMKHDILDAIHADDQSTLGGVNSGISGIVTAGASGS